MENLSYLEKLLTQWETTLLNYIPKILLAILVLIVFYFLAKSFRKVGLHFYSKMFKNQMDIARIIAAVIYFFFLLSGVFLALEILGLEGVVTKLMAGAGIIGIVAGFAFKDIASNAFAGFLLNMQRPFKKGDWVSIDNNYGMVDKMDWITTSIKTVEGQEVFVPNQMIYNNTFTNFSSFQKRRVVLKSGVSYGDELETVKAVALDEVQKISLLLKEEPIDFYFTSIGSSTFNFEVRFWIKFNHQKDYMEAMNETITRIKKRFETEDISLAYSVMTLDFGVKGGVNIFDKAIEVQATKVENKD